MSYFRLNKKSINKQYTFIRRNNMPIDKIKDLEQMYEYLLEQMKCRKDKSLLKQFYNKVMEIVKEKNNGKL